MFLPPLRRGPRTACVVAHFLMGVSDRISVFLGWKGVVWPPNLFSAPTKLAAFAASVL
jgi:hypothetical protein